METCITYTDSSNCPLMTLYKIMGINPSVLAFAENTTNGCHITFGTVTDNDYTITLENCILTGANKMAFTFQGTGFDIFTNVENSALKVSVYDAKDFEIKNYTYTSNGTDKKGISVVRKSGSPDDAQALKDVLKFLNEDDGKVVSFDMEKYGTYVVVAQKTGADNIQVDGITVF